MLMNKSLYYRILLLTSICLFVITLCLFTSCLNQNGYPERSPNELMQLMSNRYLHELADGEYIKGDWDTVKASKPPEGIIWDYPWGVMLYGLFRVSEVTGDTGFSTFAINHNRIAANQFAYLRWQREVFKDTVNVAGMEELMILNELDHCGAMTSQFMEGVLRHGAEMTPAMDELAKIVADYITYGQSRLPDGTLWRPERENTIWGDDLYMSCPFLVRYAEYTHDESYLDDAVQQTLNMASYLQDEDGLWWHGYLVDDQKDTGFKWGRANGWAMVSTAEVLSAMSKDHLNYNDVLAVLQKHIEGIKPLQAKSGLWRQILNDESVWEETSCTAMFTYVISRAVRKGWIDPGNLKIAEKAISGLNQQIDLEGGLLEVCRGTAIGFDREFYVNRPRPYDDDHGWGAVLLALSEFQLAKQEM